MKPYDFCKAPWVENWRASRAGELEAALRTEERNMAERQGQQEKNTEGETLREKRKRKEGRDLEDFYTARGDAVCWSWQPACPQ